MTKEVSVSSIVQLFFNNIFSLIFVFVSSFMLSYFFSNDILEKKYISVSYLQIGKVDGHDLGSVGIMLDQVNSTSFDIILRENYDVPKSSKYKFRRSLEAQSLMELRVTNVNPEDGTHLQNILLSMIRDMQKNKYETHINGLRLKILKLEDNIKELQFDKLDTSPAFTGDKEFGALVAYLEISEKRQRSQREMKTKIFNLERKISSATRTSYISSPRTKDPLSISFPNSKTHLGFGVLLSLFFVIYLLYREFRNVLR